jgi:signal transduction histidine kinase
MRLAMFIRGNLELILLGWEGFARSIKELDNANTFELRGHAKSLLIAIAVDIETDQTDSESYIKSRGARDFSSQDTVAEYHAISRIESGFSINDLLSEFRFLRSNIITLWNLENLSDKSFIILDMIRFNESIDQLIAIATLKYSAILKNSQNVFLAILGHDIKNPVGAISMAVQILLRNSTFTEKQKKLLEQINRSVKRTDEMILNLLDFSATQLGGEMSVYFLPINFSEECLNIKNELETFYPKRIILLEMDGDLNASWDKARIGQVLSNLIANAISHGDPNKPIWVTAIGDNESIVFTIQNEGKVIPPIELRHLFDPVKRFSFFSDSKNTINIDRHLGLGLFIISSIIRLHNGSINVTSTLLGGTTFTVKLPKFPVSEVIEST